MSTDGLNVQLSELKTQIKTNAPAEVFDTFAEEQRTLVSSADPSGFVQAGDRVEPFTLPDADGAPVDLSRLLAAGPVVIVFYRGGWCPYCNLTLRANQRELLPELERLGAALVAISPQTPDGSLSVKETAELAFPVLSDVGNKVARSLGITHRPSAETRATSQALGNDLGKVNGTGEWELPHPTVLVLDRDGSVAFADVHPDYTSRTEPAAILTAVRAVV
ncbi:peroxiredoxin-like family protein [Streptomyces sp. NPDC002514]|uniref:peroxiredoxin-like family protein n=1 Tax=Streptomyces sp. NPDC001270 TaxID=3364554 RepID=UPI00367B7426